MASKTSATFPLIDFSNEHLKSGTSVWDSTREQVQFALENQSVFLVAYDQISEQLGKAVNLALKELFNLPTQKRVEFTPHDKPYLGYRGQASQLPVVELLGIGDTTKMETLEDFVNFMFPSEKKDYFCEVMHSFSKKVAELQEMILKMVFESYGVEKYYQSHKESTAYVCRANRYKGPRMGESIGAHTDSTFLTILHQNQVNGLEVKTTDGRWIPVDFPPSSFAVLAGDALMAWSNGRIRSIVHGVRMSGEETRYSIGMFSYKNGIVQAPKELVDEQHPLLFKPFDHFELLSLIYEKKIFGIEDKLKVLCGI